MLTTEIDNKLTQKQLNLRKTPFRLIVFIVVFKELLRKPVFK